MDRGMVGWVSRLIDSWIDGLMNGCTSGWVVGGWVGMQANVFKPNLRAFFSLVKTLRLAI